MKLKEERKAALNSVDAFLKKFEGRYEKIGAGGIKEVSLKENVEGQLLFKREKEKKDKEENPISMRKKNNKMFSKMMNQYNILTMGDYKNINSKSINNDILKEDFHYSASNKYSNNNNYEINSNNYNINNYENNTINISNNNEDIYKINDSNILNNKKSIHNNYNFNNYSENKRINYSPKLNQNNSFPIFESTNSNSNYNYRYNNYYEQNSNQNLENERLYKPYSLKEYKNIMEDYKNNKFGGLGKNMNNEWKKREKNLNKVKKFENSVIKNFNKKVHEANYKRVQSPQKMELMKIGQQIMNSKRFAAQKYGKKIILKKVREKNQKEKEDINKNKKIEEQAKYLRHHQYERKQKDENLINIYDNVINEKKNNYMDKLFSLKASLI